MTDKSSDRGVGRFYRNKARSDKKKAVHKGWKYREYHEQGRNQESWSSKQVQLYSSFRTGAIPSLPI